MDYCKNCGASRMKLIKGYWCCDYCDSKFPATRDERSAYSAPDKNNALGKHGEIASVIGISDDVERLLKKCETDRKNARRYANLILDIDPDNEEALRYLH